MADELPPLTAAAQRAAERMAAREAAAAQAAAEGRDPQEAARRAAADVVRSQRRDRGGARRTARPGPPPARQQERVEALTVGSEPAAAAPRGAVDTDPRRQPQGRQPRQPQPGPSLEKPVEETPAKAAGRARNTAIFSLLTAFSRVAGLLREILAARFYGTTGAASAFTLAFQIPNLLRSLFADAALSAAFVPVFTDLLQQGRRREAFKLASELAWVVLLVLTAVTAVAILLTPVFVPLIAGDKLDGADTDLAVILTQIMFPVVVLLGINGLLVGILNAEDHFTIPALSPVVWNLVIMLCMVVSHLALDGPDELYGYAIGVLIGTAAQLLMAIPLVRQYGFQMGKRPRRDRQHPEVRQVLILMVPVALGLGLVNFNLLINSILGSKISEAAPRAIDAAFRLYMLPQGIFSVAIATVLFPALSRAAARHDHTDLRAILGDGMRQILVLLIPAAAISIALAEPIVRLIYQGGEFTAQSTDVTTEALWVFSLTLPLNGLNLLFTRTFFALKDPWATTRLAVLSLVVNVIVSLALYKPLGVGGIVAGTVAANIVVVGSQMTLLHGRLGGSLQLARTLVTAAKVVVAAAALTLVALAVDQVVRGVLGGSHLSLLISLGLALGIGSVAYVFALRALKVSEAIRLEQALRAKLGR